MEEGKPSNVLPPDSIKSIASVRNEQGYPLAAELSPSPELEAKPQTITDKDDVDLSDAPLSDTLQRFNDLDKSSPRFPDQLIGLLSREEHGTRVTELPGEDAAWLINYLDEVCLCCASSTLC
jgi:hypothetical protein